MGSTPPAQSQTILPSVALPNNHTLAYPQQNGVAKRVSWRLVEAVPFILADSALPADLWV